MHATNAHRSGGMPYQQQGKRLRGKGTWVVGDIVGRRDGACRHPRLLSDAFGEIEAPKALLM
jgi:hypothetical protein